MTAVACAAALVGISACGSGSGGKNDDAKGDTKPSATASAKASEAPKKSDLDGLSAQETLRKAQSALGAAKSLHLKQDNNETGRNIRIDLFSDTKGNCNATVSNADEGSNTVVKRDNKVWMKPDSTMMEKEFGGKAAAAQGVLKDRWIGGSDNDPMLKKPAKVCDLLPTMQRKILASDESRTQLTKGEPTTVEGVRVIPLKGTNAKGAQVEMDVVVDGPHYPVKMVETDNGKTTTSLFSDYDKPLPATTPSAAETLDAVEFRAQAKTAGGAAA
ncbi:hypothetical protein [Streptomyces sp. UNOC14_S4]|uniref:hypothetical protein n=1 Tax=Streptomyces sp. UNOC14_S4 TaxID=2872340 RepID=UPI001E475887|nr:hypothetical protein [Streptomyces sp. UNOC14_S4]MCC3767732.1 hypothetical protein [Streptomyces sp. UNOC14_S4]